MPKHGAPHRKRRRGKSRRRPAGRPVGLIFPEPKPRTPRFRKFPKRTKRRKGRRGRHGDGFFKDFAKGFVKGVKIPIQLAQSLGLL